MKKIMYREGKPSQQVLTLVLAFLISFLIGNGVASILLIALGTSPVAMLTANCICQIIGFFVPAMYLACRYYQEPLQYLQIQRGPHLGRYLLWGLVLTLVLIPFNNSITQFNEQLRLPAALHTLEESLRSIAAQSETLLMQGLANTSWAQLIFNLVAIALVPAFCEEVLFRGAIQQLIYRTTYRPHLAIIVTAAIFSIAHGDIFGFLPRFLLGLMLGYLFYQSRSIWVSMAAHFMNNALVVLLFFVYHRGWTPLNLAEEMQFHWTVVALSLLASAAVFYLVFYRKPSSADADSPESI